MRYDEQRGIYRDCRFCRGAGCLACPSEASKAYEADFPNGPQPILSVRIDDAEGIEKLRKFLEANGLAPAAPPTPEKERG